MVDDRRVILRYYLTLANCCTDLSGLSGVAIFGFRVVVTLGFSVPRAIGSQGALNDGAAVGFIIAATNAIEALCSNRLITGESLPGHVFE